MKRLRPLALGLLVVGGGCLLGWWIHGCGSDAADGAEQTPTLCQDQLDNDGDGDIDCDDTDCREFVFCDQDESSAAACQDGKDNDGDGDTDCDDSDCRGLIACAAGQEDSAARCDDKLDNDNDGKTDCADSDCAAFCEATSAEDTAALCQDGKDNDEDTKLDCADEDCQGFTFCAANVETTPARCSDNEDNDEDGKTDCADEDCQGFTFCPAPTEQTSAACQDGQDNDNDTKTDCDDEDCAAFVFCAPQSESTSGECQDTEDNDNDTKTDCDDEGCWAWHFCGHYNGYPVSDAWGATWDGVARSLKTYDEAKAICEGLSGRLPTVTELYRNNVVSGTSTISGPGATEYLWTAISPRQADNKVIVRLSDGTTSNSAETTARQFRCIWPDDQTTSGFNADRCHGQPGGNCQAVGDEWNIDRWDRPKLDYVAATNECAFYGASIPALVDWTAAIHGGLTGGSNDWVWVAKAVTWYRNANPRGLGMPVIRWSGAGTPHWYYLYNSMGSLSWGSDPRAFRCIGLHSPDDFTVPVPTTCSGGTCRTTSARRSPLATDGVDRSALDFSSALIDCRNEGADLPNMAEVTELVHTGWGNGSNDWIWLADAVYWYNGNYGHPLARWTATGTDHWYFDATGGNGGVSVGTTARNYRCVWRTPRVALPSCQQPSQVIERQANGSYACVAGQAGSSGGQANPSEIVDDWNNAWDSVERTPAAVYADAKTTCESAGGRLPTATEVYRVRAGSDNPHTAIGADTNTSYLWTETLGRTASARVVVRVSDGAAAAPRDEGQTAPYRCIWPAKPSDVLHGSNCYGPPGSECFAAGDLIADTYDRIALDVAAAANECATSGGRLPDLRELTQLIHDGLPSDVPDGSADTVDNAWVWVDEPVYWWSGNYGYARARWAAADTTNWDYITGNAAVSAGATAQAFRCVYSTRLR